MTEVLAVHEASFIRSGSEILRAIDMSVGAGEHWALLGPNGAGKSTLLNLCAAVTFPSRGHVEVLGHRMGTYDLRELRREIGFVNPRHPLQSNLGVEEIVLTGITGSIEPVPRWEPTEEQVERAHQLMKLTGVDTPSSPHWLTMSQGERTRTLIARAVIAEPSLLLLDEPTTGLDLPAREQLLAILDELRRVEPDMASVTVSHHFEELPSSTTHAYLLRNGHEVASGPVDEVLTSALVSECFAHPIEVRRTAGRWSASAVFDA